MEGSSSIKALLLLWLAGGALRLTMLAVPPVLALIIFDLKLSGTAVGILNAIPVFLFAIVAVLGAALIARVGAVPALLIGLAVTAVGSFLRGFAWNGAFLYATTTVMAAGIALMQPALPPTVRMWVPNKIGFATAVYTNGLIFGEIFPVMFASMLLPLLGGWQVSLMFWSLPVAAIAIVIFFFQPQATNVETTIVHRRTTKLRKSLVLKIGLMMGSVNQLYFCTHAFLPGHLLKIGQGDWTGSALTALNIAQLPASFLLLATASRWERKRWPLVGAGLIALLGIAGIVIGIWPWLVVSGAAMIGIACAIVLTIALALPALLFSPDELPAVSAGIFVIGYSIAVISSILGGLAWDASQSPTAAFIPTTLAVFFVVLIPLFTDFSDRRDGPSSENS